MSFTTAQASATSAPITLWNQVDSSTKTFPYEPMTVKEFVLTNASAFLHKDLTVLLNGASCDSEDSLEPGDKVSLTLTNVAAG